MLPPKIESLMREQIDVNLLKRAENPEWLSIATKVIAKHWLRKNQRKSAHARSAAQFAVFGPVKD
jgi:hypothetical protein